MKERKALWDLDMNLKLCTVGLNHTSCMVGVLISTTDYSIQLRPSQRSVSSQRYNEIHRSQ